MSRRMSCSPGSASARTGDATAARRSRGRRRREAPRGSAPADPPETPPAPRGARGRSTVSTSNRPGSPIGRSVKLAAVSSRRNPKKRNEPARVKNPPPGESSSGPFRRAVPHATSTTKRSAATISRADSWGSIVPAIGGYGLRHPGSEIRVETRIGAQRGTPPQISRM